MKRAIIIGTALLTLMLQGCHHDDSPAAERSYQITVTNMTANQPFSPLSVVLHDSDYQPIGLGMAASLGLEMLAEGGDNSLFLSDAMDADADTAAGAGLLLPGASEQLTITSRDYRLSLAAMLVNTNDAFAGLEGHDLSELQRGESKLLWSAAFDAGSEANNEAMADIPGPAGGGEGFNSVRDDYQDQVRIHSGLLTQAEGLASSVLDQSHRFINPVAKVEIKRLK